MSAVTRRMDLSGDFTSRGPSTSTSQSLGVSSTSGDGEPSSTVAININAKRKPRRKTITLNEITQRTANAANGGGGGQSVSESAFGSPPCSPLRLPPLQTSGFSFYSVSAGAVAGETGETTTPRRASSRIAALSSPVKTQPGSGVGSSKPFTASAPGAKSSSTQAKMIPSTSTQKRPGVMRETSVVSISSEGGRFGGKGIPRTSTLPAHFTDSLMRMKISREDTSVESLTLNTPTGAPNLDPDPNGQANGGNGAGMEIDGQSNQTQNEGNLILSSPRKGKTRRRARSLPPTPSLTPIQPEEDENDADDEGEGINGTPIVLPGSPRKRRGRPGPGDRGDGGPATMLGDHVIMPGVEAAEAPALLRRSARHIRTMDQMNMGDSGGSQDVAIMEDITRLGGLGGMERGIGITRKRARTREGREDSRGRRGMALGDGEEDESAEGRAFKRSRRR